MGNVKALAKKQQSVLNREKYGMDKVLFGEREEYVNPTAESGHIIGGAINRSNELLGNMAQGYGQIINTMALEMGADPSKLQIKEMAEAFDQYVHETNKLDVKETHDWKQLKEAFKAGGVFDIDTIQELFNYGGEQGVKSIADMGFLVLNLPSYIVSFGREKAETRMEEKGLKGQEPTTEDLLIGLGGATVSAMLERFGLKATTVDIVNYLTKELVGKSYKEATQIIAKEVGKGTIKEAVPEFAQEGFVEPATERIATGTDKDLYDLEQGFAGSLAGGVAGGSMSTASATGTQLYNNSEVGRKANTEKAVTAIIDSHGFEEFTTEDTANQVRGEQRLVMPEGRVVKPQTVQLPPEKKQELIVGLSQELQDMSDEELEEVIEVVQKQIPYITPEDIENVQKLIPDLTESDVEAIVNVVIDEVESRQSNLNESEEYELRQLEEADELTDDEVWRMEDLQMKREGVSQNPTESTEPEQIEPKAVEPIQEVKPVEKEVEPPISELDQNIKNKQERIKELEDFLSDPEITEAEKRIRQKQLDGNREDLKNLQAEKPKPKPKRVMPDNRKPAIEYRGSDGTPKRINRADFTKLVGINKAIKANKPLTETQKKLKEEHIEYFDEYRDNFTDKSEYDNLTTALDTNEDMGEEYDPELDKKSDSTISKTIENVRGERAFGGEQTETKSIKPFKSKLFKKKQSSIVNIIGSAKALGTEPTKTKSIRPAEPRAKEVSEKSNWREKLSKAKDPSDRADILRAIADISKSDQELNDILDNLEEIEKGNITWAVHTNPSANEKTKQRAKNIYDEHMKPKEVDPYAGLDRDQKEYYKKIKNQKRPTLADRNKMQDLDNIILQHNRENPYKNIQEERRARAWDSYSNVHKKEIIENLKKEKNSSFINNFQENWHNSDFMQLSPQIRGELWGKIGETMEKSIYESVPEAEKRAFWEDHYKKGGFEPRRIKDFMDEHPEKQSWEEVKNNEKFNGYDFFTNKRYDEYLSKRESTEEEITPEKEPRFEHGDYKLAYDLMSTEKKQKSGSQNTLFGQGQLIDTEGSVDYIIPTWAKKLVTDTTRYEDIIKAITEGQAGKNSDLGERAIDAMLKSGIMKDTHKQRVDNASSKAEQEKTLPEATPDQTPEEKSLENIKTKYGKEWERATLFDRGTHEFYVPSTDAGMEKLLKRMNEADKEWEFKVTDEYVLIKKKKETKRERIHRRALEVNAEENKAKKEAKKKDQKTIITERGKEVGEKYPVLAGVETDISFDEATRSRSGISFSPEKRGEQIVSSYIENLVATYEGLKKLVKTPEQQELLDKEFARYREGYKKRKKVVLARDARVMSTMITGAGNFPVASNKKKSDSAMKALNELIDFENKAEGAIRSKLLGSETIKINEENAVQKLQKRVDDLVQIHENMKKANSILRSTKTTKKEKVVKLREMGYSDKVIVDIMSDKFTGKAGFASFSLTNSNNRIKTAKAKLKEAENLAVKAEQGNTEITFDNGKVEYNYADNRIRFIFDDMPTPEQIKLLKSKSFKWSPKNKAWQRQLTRNAESVTKEIMAELLGTPKEASVEDTIENPTVQNIVEEYEHRIKYNSEFETLVVIDENGRVILKKGGTKGEVRISNMERNQLLLEKSRGLIATHNHPSSSSFSDEDIKTAVKYGLAEIRAIGLTKDAHYLYSLTNIDNGYFKGMSDFEIGHIIGVAYNEADLKHNAYFEPRAKKAGNASHKTYGQAHSHKILMDLAEKFGFTYTRTKIRPKRNFKEWFSGSTVVDSKGEPLVVYHGTSLSFGTFQNKVNWFTPDIKLAEEYAISDRIDGKTVATDGEGANIMPVYLKLRNPLEIRKVGIERTARDFAYEVLNGDVDQVKSLPEKDQQRILENIKKLDNTKQQPLWELWDNNEDLVNLFSAMGYDGFKTSESGSTTYGVFSANQIKSTFNKGYWSTTTNDISAMPVDFLDANPGIASTLSPEQKKELTELWVLGGKPTFTQLDHVISNGDGTFSAGQYDNNAHHVSISKGYGSNFRVLKHELLHPIYNKLIRDNPSLGTKLAGLVSELERDLEERGLDSRDHYGLDHTEEFLPEFFSNPEFRKLLDTTPYTGRMKVDGKKPKTLLEAFIAFFKEILGMQKPKPTVTDMVNTLLNEYKVEARTPDVIMPNGKRLSGAEAFRSGLEMALDSTNQKVWNKKQILGFLEKRGIQKEELDWSGITEFLDSKEDSDKIFKEDIENAVDLPHLETKQKGRTILHPEDMTKEKWENLKEAHEKYIDLHPFGLNIEIGREKRKLDGLPTKILKNPQPEQEGEFDFMSLLEDPNAEKIPNPEFKKQKEKIEALKEKLSTAVEERNKLAKEFPELLHWVNRNYDQYPKSVGTKYDTWTEKDIGGKNYREVLTIYRTKEAQQKHEAYLEAKKEIGEVTEEQQDGVKKYNTEKDNIVDKIIEVNKAMDDILFKMVITDGTAHSYDHAREQMKGDTKWEALIAERNKHGEVSQALSDNYEKTQKEINTRRTKLFNKIENYERFSSEGYRDSHWLDDRGVLYWVRKQDVKIDKGNALFIEEIQSGQHQKGRKYGYKDPKDQEKLEKLEAEYEDLFQETKIKREIHNNALDLVRKLEWSEEATKEYQEGNKEFIALVKKGDDKLRQIHKAREAINSRIDTAPYGDTWHEIAMKEQINEAVVNGYDYIAWTTGDMQNQRYNLKLVSAKAKLKNGKYTVSLFNEEGHFETLNNQTKEGLAEELGDEIAETIVERTKELENEYDGWTVFHKEDLKDSGKGMKGFYDKKVKYWASKYIKKYKAKVEVKRLYKEGFEEEAKRIEADNKIRREDTPIEDYTQEIIDNSEKRLNEIAPQVWAIKITDKMKKDIEEKGQATFGNLPAVEENTKKYGEQNQEYADKNLRPAFIKLTDVLIAPSRGLTYVVNATNRVLAENVLGKIKDTKVDSFIRKYLGGSMSGLGQLTRGQETDFVKHYRKLKAGMAKAEMTAEQVADLIGEHFTNMDKQFFQNILSGNPGLLGNVTPQQLATMNEELFQKMYNAIVVRYLENPNSREEIQDLFPELAEELDLVRDYIDDLSREAMRKGLILPSQFKKWEDKYLSRLYLAQNPKLDRAVEAKAGIKMKTMASGRKIESIVDYIAEFPQEAQRLGVIIDPELMIKMTIAKTQGNIAIEEFFRGITERSSLVHQDSLVSLSEPIVDLPMEFSGYYGIEVVIPYIKDMIINLQNDMENNNYDSATIGNINQYINDLKAEAKRIKEDSKEAILTAEDHGRKDYALIPEDRRYGSIAGLPMSKDLVSLVKAQFQILHEPEMISDGIESATKIFLTYFKWAKVPANVFAYPRNVMSNIFQWTMSGADPATFIPEYMRAILSYATKDEWYQKARMNGLIDDNMMSVEINNSLKSIAMGVQGDSTGAKAKKAMLEIMQKVGNAYGVIDDFAKIARMRYAVETDGETELEGAEVAQNAHYDYGLTYDLIRGMRDPDMNRNPMLKVIGTLFPTYTQKTIAFLYDTLLNRPATLALVGLGLSMLMNTSDDEDEYERVNGKEALETLKKTYPEWVKGNPLIRVDIEQINGHWQVTFTDISYVVPFGALLAGAYGSISTEDPVKFAQSLGIAGSPLMMIGDLKTNRDSYTGKEIYYEHDQGQKYIDIAKHIGKQLAPSTFTKIYSLSQTRHPVVPRLIGINAYSYAPSDLERGQEWKAKRAKMDAGKRASKYKAINRRAKADLDKGKITVDKYEKIKKGADENIKDWKERGIEDYRKLSPAPTQDIEFKENVKFSRDLVKEFKDLANKVKRSPEDKQLFLNKRKTLDLKTLTNLEKVRKITEKKIRKFKKQIKTVDNSDWKPERREQVIKSIRGKITKAYEDGNKHYIRVKKQYKK